MSTYRLETSISGIGTAAVFYKTLTLLVQFRVFHYVTALKGSVQRKLRWVENGANRCVWAWDCGAGRFYVVLLRLHLVFTIFRFQSVLPKL